ncbi:unnamed protein product [Amoebophrya sp. A120]|nr:unnamed protein product [Amoebophrya sp. A120]|eukprot:GSA120T00004833001.1
MQVLDPDGDSDPGDDSDFRPTGFPAARERSSGADGDENLYHVKLKIFHTGGGGTTTFSGSYAVQPKPPGQQLVQQDQEPLFQRIEILEVAVSSYEDLAEFVRTHLQDWHCEWQMLSGANVPFTEDLLYSRLSSRRLPVLVFVRKAASLYQRELQEVVARAETKLLEKLQDDQEGREFYLKTMEARVQEAERGVADLSDLFTLPPRSPSAKSVWFVVSAELLILLVFAVWVVKLSVARLDKDEMSVRHWGQRLNRSLNELEVQSANNFTLAFGLLETDNRTLSRTVNTLNVTTTALNISETQVAQLGTALNTSHANATRLAVAERFWKQDSLAARTELNATSAEVSSLQIRLRASEAEILRLQSALQTAQAGESALGSRLNVSYSELNNTRAARSDLQRALADSQGLIAQLRGKEGQEQAKVANLTQELQRRETADEGIRSKLAATEKALQDTTGKLGNMTHLKDVLQYQLSLLTRDLRDTKSQLGKEVARDRTLEGQVATLQSELDASRSQNADLIAEVAAENRTLQGEEAVLRQRNTSIATTEKELQSAQQANAGLRRSLNVKKQQLANATEKVAQERADAEESENSLELSRTKLGLAENEISTLQATLLSSQKNATRLQTAVNAEEVQDRKHLNALSTTQASLASSRAEISSLNGALASANGNATAVAREEQADQTTISDLRARLSADVGNAAALRTQLHDSRTRSQQQIQALQAKLAQCEKQKSSTIIPPTPLTSTSSTTTSTTTLPFPLLGLPPKEKIPSAEQINGLSKSRTASVVEEMLELFRSPTVFLGPEARWSSILRGQSGGDAYDDRVSKTRGSWIGGDEPDAHGQQLAPLK